VLRNRAL